MGIAGQLILQLSEPWQRHRFGQRELSRPSWSSFASGPLAAGSAGKKEGRRGDDLGRSANNEAHHLALPSTALLPVRSEPWEHRTLCEA